MIINAAKGDIQFVRKRTFHISALENEQNEQKKEKNLRYKLQQRCHCHVTYWSPVEGGLGTYKISPVISSVSHTLKCPTKCACVHASALAHYLENVVFFDFFVSNFYFVLLFHEPHLLFYYTYLLVPTLYCSPRFSGLSGGITPRYACRHTLGSIKKLFLLL